MAAVGIESLHAAARQPRDDLPIAGRDIPLRGRREGHRRAQEHDEGGGDEQAEQSGGHEGIGSVILRHAVEQGQNG